MSISGSSGVTGDAAVPAGRNYLLPLTYAAVCLVLFCAVYYPTYRIMISFWEGDDYNHCYIIPLVSLFILREKRAEFAAVETRHSWSGGGMLAVGVALYWLGELGGEFYTMYLSSWCVLVGMVWMYTGWNKMKTIGFPLLFLITMFPFPGFVSNNLTLQLKLLSSRLGVFILQMCGMSAYREGNVIDLGFTRLQVVDACSGLRYTLPLIVLGILVAYYYRTVFWKRLLLVLFSIPLSIITNSLRIASVGILYRFWGPGVAEGFFHDFSGWFIFMVSLALLLGFRQLLKRLFPDCPQEPAEPPREALPVLAGRQRGAGYALLLAIPALVLLGGTAALSTTVDYREKTPLKRPFADFPRQVGEWSGGRQALEKIYLDQLGLSDYLLMDFHGAAGGNVNFYVAYYESQRGGTASHSPASCLPGSGWEFKTSGLVDVALRDGGNIRVERAVMDKNDQQLLVYYWFPQRGRILHNLMELKLYAFWDAIVSRRTDGALVRIITPVDRAGGLAGAEARLQSFTKAVLPLMDHYLPGRSGK